MLNKIYKWLYSRIGRRPWTHIISESVDKYSAAWITIAFGVGLTIGHFLYWPHLIWLVAGLLVGLIMGHVFSDVRHKKHD